MSNLTLVTAQELAALLKVSVETVWRYTRQAKIPFVEIAQRKYRYDPVKVMQHLGLATKPPLGLTRETESVYYTDKQYTYEDYLRLPEDELHHYEILDGTLVKEPAPYVHHQRVSRRLQVMLINYFATRDPAGEVFASPIDLTLSETNVLQPDLLYITGQNSEIIEEKRINGVPLLAVEILSPSSRSKDRIRKRTIYEHLGVPHYWIIDPADKIIEAYALREQAYILRSAACAEQSEFTHPDFPDFSMDLPALWKPRGV